MYKDFQRQRLSLQLHATLNSYSYNYCKQLQLFYIITVTNYIYTNGRFALFAGLCTVLASAELSRADEKLSFCPWLFYSSKSHGLNLIFLSGIAPFALPILVQISFSLSLSPSPTHKHQFGTFLSTLWIQYLSLHFFIGESFLF